MITLLNLETCVDLHLRFVVLLRLHLLQYCQLFLMDFFQSDKHRDSLVVKLILFVHLYALVFQVVVLLLELRRHAIRERCKPYRRGKMSGCNTSLH